jgi:thymidylate synthase
MKINFEQQYANALLNVLENGIKTEDRTGVNTISVQHQYFLLENIVDNFPIVKGKKVFPKMSLIELFWMMNGFTDVKWLNDRGVKYWNEWIFEDGSIGKTYGYHFRNFNGMDNLLFLLLEMSSKPNSRRLLLNLWNVSDYHKTKMPPCVMNFHFSCIPSENKIFPNTYFVDLHVLQRSGDSFLGIPYDFMFASYFLAIISKLAGNFSKTKTMYIPRNVHYTVNDYHIYSNHVKQVEEYLKNVSENKDGIIFKHAKLELSDEINHTDLDLFLQEMDSKNYSDIKITKHYEDVYGKIQAPIAI